MKGYLITQEQIEKLEHLKRMFEFNAELINDLCRHEKDNFELVVYGGKMHSHLRQCFIEMMELESEIISQPFNTKEK